MNLRCYLLLNDESCTAAKARDCRRSQTDEYDLADMWWPYDTRGRMCPKFPDICLTVEGKPRKNHNQEIYLSGDRTWAPWEITMLPLVHSGGRNKDGYISALRSMGGSPGDVGELSVTWVKQRKCWRTSCDTGEATEWLENELRRRWSDVRAGEWGCAQA